MTLQAEYPCYFKKTGTAQTAATGDSRPPKARNGGCPNRYGTAVVPTATERRLSQSPGGRLSQPLRNGGCPNRYGTAVVQTATERRLYQPLREGGCPNRYGTAVVPTATERRLSQPLRNGGYPNRYRCVAPPKRRRLGTVALPTATERRLSQPLPIHRCRFERPITPPTPTPLTHSASAVPSTHR